VRKIYGDSFSISPNPGELAKRFSEFYYSISYFEPNIALLSSRIIKNLKKTPGKEATLPSQVIRDVTEAHIKEFAHYNEQEVFDYRNHAEYFQEFYGNLTRYVYPLPDGLKSALKALKKEGKTLFVVTNSHSGPCTQYLELLFGEVFVN
jgi:FMN phosphatase YigB (HAD superfamily)